MNGFWVFFCIWLSYIFSLKFTRSEVLSYEKQYVNFVTLIGLLFSWLSLMAAFMKYTLLTILSRASLWWSFANRALPYSDYLNLTVTRWGTR